MKRALNLPPGPRSRIPGRVFRELRRDPLAFLTKVTQQYGDIATFTSLGQRYIVVNSPDRAREILMGPPDIFWKGPALQNSKGILGEGLLTAEGEAHRWQRRLMQGSFHAKHVENYAGAIIDSTREVMTAWHNRPPAAARELIDIRAQMMGLTLVIAGRTLFGAFLADDVRTIHRCMDDLMNGYVRTVVPWGKLLNRIPIPSTLRLARAQGDLFRLVDRMIAEKMARPVGIESGKPAATEKRDLLSMMIAATEDPAPPDSQAPPAVGCPHAAAGDSGKSAAPRRLTDNQLRDQCVTILTAGHETTANAMTFTLYLLAKHSEEQSQLREEATAVLGNDGPTVDMLDRLPRARWVLSESMRLYPPAWTVGRQNQRPITLGGYSLPAKCTILMPQWTLHRSERYWNQPLAFIPDRWRDPKHPRFAYLPFSTGARNCIGESFAWLEMIFALALLVRDFSFALPAGAPELQLTPAITLRPRNPIQLQITPRTHA